MGRGQLRLVADNSGHAPKVEKVAGVADKVLDVLKDVSEEEIKTAFEACLNFPIRVETDHYLNFMGRNWRHFQSILQGIAFDENYQRRHSLANYFMMRVYLQMMIEKENIANWNGCSSTQASELSMLISDFAEKIRLADQTGREGGPDGHNFGKRIRKVMGNV